MAWDEWQRLKAEAAQGQSPHMRLNQVAPDSSDSGSSRGDLTVHQKDLMFQDFDRFSDHARASSMKAAGGLRGEGFSSMKAVGGLRSEGFAIGVALDHVAERWVDSARTLSCFSVAAPG
ncbi:hypothetical protein [Streptomyces sp. NPDC046727]|uniref:hypothetical protein n=1 Tax=Streptomyces sp. NPDC046727 TaxID=3155373 RepID=UPI0033F8B029